MKRGLFFVLGILLLAGCATNPPPPPPPPLTQADVISMAKSGSSDEDIMRRIDATRTVFRLSSDDVIHLRNEGLSDRLVTFMLDTYTRAALAEQQRRDSYYYDPFFVNYGFYYGPGWRRW